MQDKIVKLTDNEAGCYVGGASAITSALVSALTSLIKTFYTMGQDLGASIKRAITGKGC